MSTPVTQSNGQIVTPKKAGDNLAQLLQKMQGEIQRALPKHIPPDRMGRVVLTAVRTTDNLDKCDPASFLGCVLSAAQLGLEPNTPLGFCYLLPRKSKRGGYECTLMLGYQGMLDMCRRSGLISSVYAHVVYEGDDFGFHYGLDQKLRHVPCEDPGAPTHVYAVAKLKDGEPLFVVLTRKQVEGRRQRGYGKGPWLTDWDAMAMKTAVRALWRWLPKSSEIASAIGLDEAADAGRPSVLAFDPEVSAALEREGIEDAEVAEVVEEEEVAS